jgi:transcriptional regulator with XRE-family HTH domain
MSVATIGSALAEKRRELGLEKGQAADKIGMSRTTYSSYEQDAQRPSVDVFPALATFLEIPMEDLLLLYGATCVAAVRPSLEKVLANQEPESSNKTVSTDAPAPAVESTPAPSAPPVTSEPTRHVEERREPASSEVVIELSAASSESVPDSPVESSSMPSEVELELSEVQAEAQDAHVDVASTPSEVELELSEPIGDERHEPDETPEPKGVVSSVISEAVQEFIESQRERAARTDPPARLEEAPVVFEPSPFVVRTSLSELQPKSLDAKKKKKKKKKKKN